MMRRIVRWMLAPGYRLLKLAIVLGSGAVSLILAFYLVSTLTFLFSPGGERFVRWAAGSDADRESLIVTKRAACPDAPFTFPADGFVGLPYASTGGPYSRANPHQGIDIFSPDRNTPGMVPVYAAYDGYVTREADWRSSLIQRIPDDPLQPGRQIWLYYTHMADVDGNDLIVDRFAPGSRETFVEQGTMLGYTGNYNGSSLRSIWVHLHFSIVKDDGTGNYLNELRFENTIDPSPYLGMPVSAACQAPVSGCGPIETCF